MINKDFKKMRSLILTLFSLNRREITIININLDNLNYNLRIIFIRLINNNSVRKDLSTRIIIKAISDFIKTIKIINNDLKSIKAVKKTLVSRY